MLSSLLRSLLQLGRRWKPLNFSNPNFVRVPEYHKIEEETIPDYVASRYYPTRIGEVIKERYQVVGKLGFGSTSTAWLARDMNARKYVMLKIFIQTSAMAEQVDDELKMYRRMEQSPKRHPGHKAVRTLLDTFYIDGSEDKHQCLVHPPLFESILTFLRRNPVEPLPSAVIAFVLLRLFLALDYLHTECQIIHTDIKADNIMLGINDDSVFSDFEEEELQRPVPRKEVDTDGRTIYMSRDLKMPQSYAILVQPCSVTNTTRKTFNLIWDIYEGGHLFTGQDPEFQKYRSRAHLAELINLLGPPPPSLIAQGELGDKFFLPEGKLRVLLCYVQ
ncbi:hypothetical protein V493_07421 [Pseudogymnoascus sp. VKM F-4281 (FW-2241)]|nr:hypothetical protein V493_07421 [Pseudogymnoascus sp. VKM F-4281 (FW-2241)]